ncbi:MAG: LytTR family DNA-binding domain-containing protein [Gammaproteobacteria bacterium]|nr:LytTR family DNA-binding domain-containing protein [Gammaproteobacteria bacterium]
MKILVVDDEPLARARLCRLVEQLDGCQVVGEAADGAAAVAAVARLEPEVVLMDIRMPVLDGLAAAERLAELERPPAVIFTTAHEEHALAAFRARAVDYLLKPVRIERLAEALRHARRPLRSQLQALRTGEAEARTHLSVTVRGGVRRIPVADVAYFQAEQKYVTVACGERRYLIEESLKQLEEDLGEQFVRIHRNALVSAAHLEALEKDALGRWSVRLRGQEGRLGVSRRHLPGLRRLLRQPVP